MSHRRSGEALHKATQQEWVSQQAPYESEVAVDPAGPLPPLSPSAVTTDQTHCLPQLSYQDF